MKRNSVALAMLVVAACGGSDKKDTTTTAEEQPPVEQAQPTEETPPPPTEQTPAEPEPPPPPKKWWAAADLAPTKGSKLKATKVYFMQEEGQTGVAVSGAALEGLKPGKYLWVIHEKGDCAKNGAAAGPAWAGAPDLTISLEVAKGTPAAVDQSGLAVAVDGEQTIVGHALVLHQDKKGKAGKIVACGVIAESTEPEAAPAAEPAEGEGGGGGGGGG